MANKPNEQEIRQQNVAEAVSKTELFFQKNGKIVYGCVAAVLLIALAILAYNRFVLQPKKAEAQKEMFKAEQRFAQGDYELALNGDDNNYGFEDIIAKYGTKGGESVYMYAGASALQLGQFDKAIEYFKKYEGGDKILLARAQAGIGDAYVGLEDYKNAISWYEKAAATTRMIVTVSIVDDMVSIISACERMVKSSSASAFSLWLSRSICVSSSMAASLISSVTAEQTIDENHVWAAMRFITVV